MVSGSPGPGQYELRQSREGPQWVMGTSKRAEHKGSEAPGPGGYSPKHGHDGPQYSIAGKAVEVRKEFAPGPGQYEIKKEAGVGVVIGKESTRHMHQGLRKPARPLQWPRQQ